MAKAKVAIIIYWIPFEKLNFSLIERSKIVGFVTFDCEGSQMMLRRMITHELRVLFVLNTIK